MTTGNSFYSGQQVITSGANVDDAMQVAIDTGGATNVAVTANALAEYARRELFNVLPPSKLTTQAATGTAQVGGLTGALTPALTLTGTAAPVTVYFPPATELYAAAVATGLAIGDQYAVRIANLLSTTGVMTMGASTGITLSGLATLTGQNSYASFNVNIVSATAITITRIG